MTGPVDRRTIIGVDVGGTKTTVVEGTTDARILQRSERPTDASTPFARTWPHLAQTIAGTLERARQLGREPTAISVAIGGPLIAGEGRLLGPPNLPGWREVALAEEIRHRFPGLPVHIEHDAKAGALAELRFGVGMTRADLRDMIFLTLGTGLGAGIIANRRLVRGAHELAGEIWRLVISPPAGTRITSVVRWEDAASGRGIAAIAAILHPSRWPTGTPPREIIAEAVSGDAQALAVVAECGRWLGAGLAVLITVLDPELVVLGSLAVALGDRLLDPAREETATRLDRALSDICPIQPCALGARLGDVQALMAALEARAS